MNILKNINALLAKLTEQQYKPYKELYESMKEEYDKRYDHIFGVGNNRLYLNDNVEIKAVDYSADLFSVDFVRFVTFLAILTKSHFEDLYLDILYNRIYSKDGREYKLTKFLQLLTEQKLKNVTKEEYDYILNKYDVKKIISYYISNLPPKSVLSDNDKIKLSVVISRNPYDIAGMSTDRRWTSCMSLPDDDPSIHPGGAYYQHLINDIELGTLVAYLIEPTDKNIEHPYARIAIKPHQNIKDKSIMLYPESKIYHDDSLDNNIYEEFKNIVNNFLDKIQDDKEGIFRLPDQLYPDNDSNNRVKINGNIINSVDFDEVFGFRNGKTEFKNKILSEYNPILYDIYILNNTKYPKYNSNSAMVNVTNKLMDKILKEASYFEDNSINDVYSIYITEINKPIEEYISRIDVDLGIYSESLVKMLDTGDVYINPEYVNVYVSEMYIKEELKDDKILINNIVTMCKNNY